MADCNELFRVFNDTIRLSEFKRSILQGARDSLRSRMQSTFSLLPREEQIGHALEFQSQGSYVMDTIIEPEEGDYDLDDGVYFLGSLTEEQRADTNVFHKIIMTAVGTHKDIEKLEDKDTCVRVKYFRGEDLGFHIDIPIYYAEKHETPELAHKKDGWVESNPVEFIAWFEERAASSFKKEYLYESRLYSKEFEKWFSDMRKQDCQLRRIVRYLKVWANRKKTEMPSGIMMSIMAANHYVSNDRDDIALRDTLVRINEDIDKNGFICLRPTPKVGENLFDNMTKEEQGRFKIHLINLITSASQAIANPNKKEACLKWQNHLGNRFPCHLVVNEIEGAKQYSSMGAIKGDSATSA